MPNNFLNEIMRLQPVPRGPQCPGAPPDNCPILPTWGAAEAATDRHSASLVRNLKPPQEEGKLQAELYLKRYKHHKIQIAW